MLHLKIFYLFNFLIFCFTATYGQVVNNIRLVDHIPYIIEVIQRTMQDVEARQWCNLKMPDMRQDILENVFDWHVEGVVDYRNGFLVSVQAIDVIESSVQQVWSYTAATNVTQVAVTAQMRMHDLKLGFDVTFQEPGEEIQHYTSTFLHNSARFDFSVIKDIFSDDMRVTVVLGSLPRSTNRMIFMPVNNVTQVLSAQFNSDELHDGISAWATDVFQQFVTNEVLYQIDFPTLCYNCPVS